MGTVPSAPADRTTLAAEAVIKTGVTVDAAVASSQGIAAEAAAPDQPPVTKATLEAAVEAHKASSS